MRLLGIAYIVFPRDFKKKQLDWFTVMTLNKNKNSPYRISLIQPNRVYNCVGFKKLYEFDYKLMPCAVALKPKRVYVRGWPKEYHQYKGKRYMFKVYALTNEYCDNNWVQWATVESTIMDSCGLFKRRGFQEGRPRLDKD